MDQINKAMPAMPSTSEAPRDTPDASGPAEPKTLPPDEASKLEKRLTGAVAAANTAKSTAEAADSARERAQSAKTTAEKVQAELEAADLEKKAEHYVKMASKLESGAWQGAGAGIGIGAATGMGVGTVVGTIVGGVATIPTAALGGLIGAGTGAIHGPWIKFTGSGKAEERGGGDVDVKVPDELQQDGVEVPRDVIVEQAKARGIKLDDSKAEASPRAENGEQGPPDEKSWEKDEVDAPAEEPNLKNTVSKEATKGEESVEETAERREPEENTSGKERKSKKDASQPASTEVDVSDPEPEKQPAKKRKTTKPKTAEEGAEADDLDEMEVDDIESERPFKHQEEHGMGAELINKGEEDEVIDEGNG